MKGYGMTDLVPIGIIFVVAFFIFAIGSMIMDDLSETFCDYTWVTTADNWVNSSTTNPTTGGNWGCCQTAGSTSENCTTWSTNYAGNVSYQGSESLEEFSGWGPTLALVVIASIIIGVLVTYLARGRGEI